jgi:hypothetical protein
MKSSHKTTDVELKPESNSKFFYSDGSDRQFEFELDKSLNPVKSFFYQFRHENIFIQYF